MQKPQKNQENSSGISGRSLEKAICVIIATIKDNNPWGRNPKPGSALWHYEVERIRWRKMPIIFCNRGTPKVLGAIHGASGNKALGTYNNQARNNLRNKEVCNKEPHNREPYNLRNKETRNLAQMRKPEVNSVQTRTPEPKPCSP